MSAAQMLGIRLLCPIHYDVQLPGHYEEYPDALQETVRLAAGYGVELTLLKSGQPLY